ncbi:MAG TPA: hypothetical protein VLF39_02985 [Candidatus Saccharimonadales bacterium]|nr:hypothetical protein [Candidatus Saccharimonadales bacterium]
MKRVYSLQKGVEKIKTTSDTVLASIVLGITGLVLAITMPLAARADSTNINFESPTYTIGNINGQDGWTATGSAGSGCAVYDEGVVANTFGYPSFGGQSLRISDAVTSGCFGDQLFAKPLVNAVGEADSTNGIYSPGTLQRHFEMQFDFASTKQTEQVGMHTSVSPDRGDGSRMSYLRFDDQADGVHVFFDDVQGTSNPANFVESYIGTISRTTSHNIKLTLDTLDGPSNDIVKVWIDGSLVKTGTSWENYYRYDSESSAEQSPRIVKTILFREGGDSNVADSGNGFLFDNFTSLSGPIPPIGKALGSVTGGLTLSSPRQQISFNAFDYGVASSNDRGTVEYQNFDYSGGLHYTANILCATVSGNNARFMFQIPNGFPGLSGLYVLSSVHDGGTPGTKGDTYGHTATGSLATAQSWCENNTSVNNYPITGGNLVVH